MTDRLDRATLDARLDSAVLDDAVLDDAVLDNPVWSALSGSHAGFAQSVGRAARYPADISPFVGLADPADPGAWRDLHRLVGAGRKVGMSGTAATPAGWRVLARIPGVQLVDSALRAEPDPDAQPLGSTDLPEMLDLVRRTEPGPFERRTIELGGYLGIRRHGRLVAMAGQRMRPVGWTEISAVCTDPAFRGQGLAGRLVRAVAVGIRGRGETPFLHAAADNAGAIRLYEAIGFTLRREVTFTVLRSPAET
ncbi:MAG TPA: GNAT family N-acetyltransferase [Pseudonocardiaceae bacterium]|nr:GNAT family N-acetyltransferase [Pseudonocardiaceae bacterium]